jgi:hypothetical protein
MSAKKINAINRFPRREFSPGLSGLEAFREAGRGKSAIQCPVPISGLAV